MQKQLVDLYVAKNMYDAGLPKAKGDENMAEQFEQGFGLSKEFMKLVGKIEVVGAGFLALSVVSKKFALVGSVLLNVILAGAIFKHLEAGHGVKSTQAAAKLFGLNLLSMFSALKK